MAIDAQKLKSFIQQISSIAKMYGKQDVLDSIGSNVDNVMKSTSVLFCGEFKRGKSSLINAILGDNLCPTDIGIATAVVTRILYGPEKKAVRYYGNTLEENAQDDGLKKEEIKWEDIFRYTVGDILDIDYTVQMDLYYPSDFLKTGIVIIDTPGIGGLDPRHETLTTHALRFADMAVFITDASEPITQSEVRFYKDLVCSCCSRNVVLVNKSDLLVSDELNTHLETTRHSISPSETTAICPVSAMNWLLFNELQSEEFEKDSNRAQVLSAISACVSSYRKEQLQKMRDALTACIEDMLKLINEEKKGIVSKKEDQDRMMADYQKQIEDLMALRNELSNPTSPIRLKINTLFENSRNEVLNMISHEATLLTGSTFDELLNDDRGLSDDGKWLVAEINKIISLLYDKIRSTTIKTIDDISRTINKELPKVLINNHYSISDEPLELDLLNSEFAFRLTGRLTQGAIIAGAVTVGVNWLLPTTIATLIPGAGLLVGIAAAGALIFNSLSHDHAQRKKTELRKQLIPKINLAMTDLRNETNTQFTKFHQNMLDTLQKIITDAENKLKSLQASIMKSRKSQREHDEMLSTLDQREQFLHTIMAQSQLLYTSPFS